MKNSASPIRGIFVTAFYLLFFSSSLFSQISTTTPAQQCLTGNSFDFFTNNNTAGNTYYWSFGDGSTSSTQHPALHTYSSSNNYNVQLIITNAGIDQYFTFPISVNPMPVASFVTYVNTGNGSSYSFQSSSTH